MGNGISKALNIKIFRLPLRLAPSALVFLLIPVRTQTEKTRYTLAFIRDSFTAGMCRSVAKQSNSCFLHRRRRTMTETRKRRFQKNPLWRAFSRRSQSNETEPKTSRTQSNPIVRLVFDWFEPNSYRTQSNSIDAIGLILFGRKTKMVYKS